jgi:hypothetical protein
VRTIAPEDQDAFRQLNIDAGYGQFKPGLPSGRSASLWRYYTRLTKDRSLGGQTANPQPGD